MNEPKRLTLTNLNWPDKSVKENTEWVSNEDYLLLKAENERLRKLFADTERLMLIEGEYEASKVGTIANLQIKIAQLIEAGDSLAEAMEREGYYRCAYKWHIATEDIR